MGAAGRREPRIPEIWKPKKLLILIDQQRSEFHLFRIPKGGVGGAWRERADRRRVLGGHARF